MKALFVALVLAPLMAAAAQAQPIELKLAADTPSAGSLWAKSLAPWAARVTAASKGTLKVTGYPDGSLAPVGQTVNRVADGVADIGWDLPLLYGARFQSVSVAGLPFAYDEADKAAVALWRCYEAGVVLPELSNVKLLAVILNPNVDLAFKTPLKELTTLAGRKVTVGSQMRGQIVESMHGVPVSLKVPELFEALSRGVADGVMTNVAVFQAAKLDMLHYYVEGPFGGAAAILFMNKAKFDALPPDAQAAIMDNSAEIGSRRMSREAMDEEGAYMKTLLANPRNQLVKLQGEPLEVWRKSLDPISVGWEKSFPGAQAVRQRFAAELAKVGE